MKKNLVLYSWAFFHINKRSRYCFFNRIIVGELVWGQKVYFFRECTFAESRIISLRNIFLEKLSRINIPYLTILHEENCCFFVSNRLYKANLLELQEKRAFTISSLVRCVKVYVVKNDLWIGRISVIYKQTIFSLIFILWKYKHFRRFAKWIHSIRMDEALSMKF